MLFLKNVFHLICVGTEKVLVYIQALSLIETWKKVLDRKGYGGAILLNLSKAFDTINYDLLLAKLTGTCIYQ